MKLLVTGGNGLVGSHFVENYSRKNEVKTKFLHPTSLELNITNFKSVKDFFQSQRFDTVIHFAAYTDVSKAEQQRGDKKGSCWLVNVGGTENLIKATNQPYFIYISTDLVFSGHKEDPGPYDEISKPEGQLKYLSWYGWTKKEAEGLITNNLKNFAILRIANPVRAHYTLKLDYLHKILKLFDEKNLYPLFNDQFLTLTYINEVTESIKILLKERLCGVFHVSSTNLFTPYRLASFLLKKARNKKSIISPVSIKEFLGESPTRYPQYGGLKTDETQKILKISFNKWEETVISIVKQLSE